MAKDDWEYKIEKLKDGSEENMNKDGSGSNLTYKFEIPAGEEWIFHRASVFLLDSGAMTHNVFGALGSSLNDGCRFVIKRNGDDFRIKNIQDNVDLMMAFSNNVVVGSTTTGFLNDDDYFKGDIEFPTGYPVRLIGDNGDLVKMSIRDNLTGLAAFRCQIWLRRHI